MLHLIVHVLNARESFILLIDIYHLVSFTLNCSTAIQKVYINALLLLRSCFYSTFEVDVAFDCTCFECMRIILVLGRGHLVSFTLNFRFERALPIQAVQCQSWVLTYFMLNIELLVFPCQIWLGWKVDLSSFIWCCNQRNLYGWNVTTWFLSRGRVIRCHLVVRLD